jgi:cyclic pyranopterin phosphate synthase
MTTNGLLLPEYLPALISAGIDGINISLNTLDGALYRDLTGIADADANTVVQAIRLCAEAGVKTKVNAVLLEECFDGITDIAELAEALPVDVRFIELMPIGRGALNRGVSAPMALERLRKRWPDLEPSGETRGSGPASYYTSKKLKGGIGVIDAVSRGFCAECNRVRLTAAGRLKPCLCYEDSLPLRELLRSGASDAELRRRISEAVENKPEAHRFSEPEAVTESGTMNRIGG